MHRGFGAPQLIRYWALIMDPVCAEAFDASKTNRPSALQLKQLPLRLD
jgi:hypothetical protein